MMQTIPTLNTLRQHRDEILALARQYHAQRVFVFGSVARGEATPHSDIDLLIQFSPEYKLRDLLRFAQTLEALLGRPVDVIPEENIRAEYRPYIMQETQPL